jgi:hypothetical protein
MGAYADSVGNLQFVEYEIGSGNSPIDQIFNQPYTSPGSYLPRVYFRWNFQRSDANLASVEYLHGKRMAKKVGFKYNDVIDAVHLIDDERTQSDLDEVSSSFLSWAVEADTTDPIEIKYLYHHFDYWFENLYGQTITEPVFDFLDGLMTDDLFEGVLAIQDTRFKVTVGMQGLWRKTTTGSIGPVGTCTAAKGIKGISYFVTTGGEGGDITYTQTKDYGWHVYRKQINASTYIEYLVVGLETKYFVIDGYSSTSGWTEDVNDPKDILYVPVNYEVLENLTLFERDKFCYTSMRVINNSVVVVKVKWYQRGGWGTLFKIVAIYLMFSGIDGTGLLAATQVAASIGLYTLAQFVLNAVLIPLLKNAIYAAIFVKVVGEELAFLVAIVAMAYGYANTRLSLNFPYLADIAKYSTDIFKAIGQSHQRELNGISDDLSALETKASELRTIQEELDNLIPDKDALRDWFQNWFRNETPKEFFDRTIGVGNPGPKMYDLQRNMVRMALTLPKTSV